MKTCVICTDLTPWSPHIDLTAAAPHTKPRVLNYIDWDADSWKSFDASSLMGGALRARVRKVLSSRPGLWCGLCALGLDLMWPWCWKQQPQHSCLCQTLGYSTLWARRGLTACIKANTGFNTPARAARMHCGLFLGARGRERESEGGRKVGRRGGGFPVSAFVIHHPLSSLVFSSPSPHISHLPIPRRLTSAASVWWNW